jgi:dipeptidyl aminopeptidase/acylaminoacyl peptidase
VHSPSNTTSAVIAETSKTFIDYRRTAAGLTDIWGIIIRPTNFDPTKKSPVIENIYAGPQGSFVPKTFGTQTGMQTLADLGCIVVQVDGMGTANRSEAFHDVAWKDLADAGFPDRILWHKAIAVKYPSSDITKVGIYGTSAGGHNATGAVLFHPEFYEAASSKTEHAKNLQGALFPLVGEMDTNVDPSSTMQVVNQLILAGKNFDLLVMPNQDHTGGGAYGDHKRFDFFVRILRGIEPLSWNNVPATRSAGIGPVFDETSVLDLDALPRVASEDWGRNPS